MANDCKSAAFAPPSRSQFEEGDAMTKVENILVFFCMSAFFAGLVIAVATLPV
jgi:hypothetical protein